jgi:hypothetical protein
MDYVPITLETAANLSRLPEYETDTRSGGSSLYGLKSRVAHAAALAEPQGRSSKRDVTMCFTMGQL